MSTTDEVLAAARDLVQAFGRHDTAAYFDCFAPDATFIFYTTAARLASRDEYQRLWRQWERQDDFRVQSCTSARPVVQDLGDAAVFSHDVTTVIRTRADMGCVLIAPDKFKGTLSAAQVAAHVAAGLGRVRPGLNTVQVPVADGGDGTVDAAEAAGFRRIEIGVHGPTGKAVTASFALLDGTAVIESAQACGLARLPGGAAAPLTATSRGVGELILAAVRMRAKRIVLGLGGVACTDGGAGLVTALGGRLLDSSGAELPPGGAALVRLDHVDASRLRDLSGTEVVAATDVDNPLLGPHGAAAVYGPQKGASWQDVASLEEGLARWADVAEQSFGFVKRDEPGAGAAGGLGFAALGFLGATMQPGIELMLNLLSFDSHLSGARLVITGEGALDDQTLHGKAPAGVARAAAAAAPDLPVVAVAGVCSLTPAQLRSAGIARAYALADIEPDLARCREQAGPLLEDLAEQVARDWIAP